MYIGEVLFNLMSDLKHCFPFFGVFIFSLWLRNNEPDATKKQNASVPRREELKRLKRELIQKLGLLDIRSALCQTTCSYSLLNLTFGIN